MDLGLTQRKLAERLQVTRSTVGKWEKGLVKPGDRSALRIIQLLGYDPDPPADTFSGCLLAHRRATGLSRRRLAEQLGVSRRTVDRWETGKPLPSPEVQERVSAQLSP